jgi:hypothetical protein
LKAPIGTALHARSKPLTLKIPQNSAFAKSVENQLRKFLPPSAVLPDLEKDNYEIKKEFFCSTVHFDKYQSFSDQQMHNLLTI